MRSAPFIAVLAVLVLLAGGAIGVYAYDRGREDTIAEGVRVGGVDVGGLSRAAATRRLRAALAEPLTAPVVVRAHGMRQTLTGEVAKVAVDIEATVDEALRRSRTGNPVTRTMRSLTGGKVRADLEPDVTYSRAAVRRLVRRVARNVDRPARDAKVAFSGDGVHRVRSRTGLEVDRQALQARVERALLDPSADARRVRAPVRRTKPEVTTAELADRYDTVITINRGAFRLRLFKHLKLVKQYPIAVGRVGLETPAGRYAIQNKAINPAWNVPHSAWAGDLAGKVIPGGAPDNPLKARWMGIYAGAGIHGTAERGSIGTNASHGCIRMLIEDVIDLYDRVPVGTPVYIA